MARPLSDGVGYCPLDVGFFGSDEARLLRGEFGIKGVYICLYLYCEIYGKNGYFMKWDDVKCALVSDGAGGGCTTSFVREVVAGCIRCGVFNRSVFERYGVLTSAGIQRRYVRMFNGRDYIRLAKEYFVLDVNDKKDITPGILEKCTFFSAETTENPDKSTENPDKNKENDPNKKRVKETKLKERENAPARKDLVHFGSFENVMISRSEYEELVGKFGKALAEELIETFSQKLKSKGYKYDDHYATILLWAEKDGKKPISEVNAAGSFDTEEFFKAALLRSSPSKG